MKQIFVNPHEVEYVQSRAAMNEDTFKRYAQDMSEGIEFKPIQAVQTPDGRIVSFDGAHRIEGARLAGVMITADIIPGSYELAVFRSFGVNGTHGLPRTQADIEKEVKDALLHPRARKLSSRAIAKLCKVSHPTVEKYRKELVESGKLTTSNKRTVTRGDQTYEYELEHDKGKQTAFDMEIPEPPSKEEPQHTAPQVCVSEQYHKTGKPADKLNNADFYATINLTQRKNWTCPQCQTHYIQGFSLQEEDICQQCSAMNARDMYAQQEEEPVEVEVETDVFSPVWQDEDGEEEQPDNTPFEFYAEDRVKILRAGLRLFKILKRELVLLELCFFDSERVLWRQTETFDTLETLKTRAAELAQDEKIIFENHLD